MYRILLVDDEILVRDAIRENIDWAALDCELVADCENGRQALEIIGEKEVDIVLTDILMPYMDGMELSRCLHEQYPDIVIVIFSGFGEFEYAKKAIEYNVSEYMLKPVTSMDIKEVIGKMKLKVDQIRKEKQRLQTLSQDSSDYKKNALVIRSRAFETLVLRTGEMEESLLELERMGILFEAALYRPVIFDMEVYASGGMQSAEKQQESALMAFILFNISDEIMQREQMGYAWTQGNSRVNLLFMAKQEQITDETVYQILKEIRDQVFGTIGIDISVSLGKWVRHPADLYRSHVLAVEALSRRYVLGDNMIIDMEHTELGRPLSLERSNEKLAQLIKSGSPEEIEQLLNSMEQEIRESLTDKTRACMEMQRMIRTVKDTLAGIDESLLEESDNSSQLIQEVTGHRLFSQAMEEVRQYALEGCKKRMDLNSPAGQKQAVMALDYLQSHYMDENLNLNEVCSYLNISTSYFSTIFKELTGETFIEALTKIRMEKAKELLEHTKFRNYEIAEKVGFSDPHYFGIAFKKMTGKTPTEYAKEMRK